PASRKKPHAFTPQSCGLFVCGQQGEIHVARWQNGYPRGSAAQLRKSDWAIRRTSAMRPRSFPKSLRAPKKPFTMKALRLLALAGFIRLLDNTFQSTGHPSRKIRVTGYLMWDDLHSMIREAHR